MRAVQQTLFDDTYQSKLGRKRNGGKRRPAERGNYFLADNKLSKCGDVSSEEDKDSGPRRGENPKSEGAVYAPSRKFA